jgi:hypothetical protein
MKTFLQWAKDNSRDVMFSEKSIRTGIHYPMPKGYIRSQYPDLYFPPGLATADLDMKNQDKLVKDKAPSDGAP